METDKKDSRLSGWLNRLKEFQGDKVILIIVLLLILISFLAIFSSTPLLPSQASRIATMKEHGIIAIFGILVMFLLYRFDFKWIKYLSQAGFAVSFILLALLLMKVDFGFFKVEVRNSAVRNFVFLGKQIHVFEIVKVAMVMYLAWAMNAIKEDMNARREKRKSETLRFGNWLAEQGPKLRFMKKTRGKRILYVYIPSIIIVMMLFFGSGSSSLFVGAVLIALMIVGGVPMKELALAGFIGLAGIGSLVGIHELSDGKYVKRVATIINRMKADYDMERLNGLKGDEYFNMLDTLRQPVSAKMAVHEGKLIGKGIGNSTQKYKVDNIYGDYMYSFIIEEYGLLGGILVLILYVSLLARSSIIARMCEDEFAKFAIGGLAILVSGQAFMHIMVNVDIGPMTGQTLPLISHGASAFLVFCVAFGIMLSISRIARSNIEKMENEI